MAKLLISPEAQQNIDHQEDFLVDEAGIEVALRFHDALLHALHRLVEMPELGSLREFLNPRLHGLRMWPIPGFPNYLVYYRLVGDELQVLWVLHGAQDRDRISVDQDEQSDSP